MNVPKLNQLQVSHRRRLTISTLWLVLSMVLSNLLPLSPLMTSTAMAAPATAPVAQTTQFTLSVVSARTEPNAPGGPVVKGQPITEFKYMINLDNTGDPTQAREDGCSPENPNGSENVNYPDSCDWPSIREMPGHAPIVLQGDQDDFAVGAPAINLPAGKYLVSVIAEGYKIDGKHFTVPMTTPGVTVEMQPHPLPSATMRIQVYEDKSPVNGMFDAPAEQGLAGFRAVVNDILGQVSTDVFGNPLCTTYDTNGEPNGQTNCLISNANGDIAIPNLGPNRFDVAVVPPDGTNWTETSTLEGSPSWDTWLAEGGTGLDNEFVVAGEPFPWTQFAFVRPMNTLTTNATGGVRGQIQAVSVYAPKKGGVPYVGGIWDGFNGNRVIGPITDGWVALSDLQNGDTAVYVGRANADGTFQINHVPNGDYFLTWWDTNLNYILDWIQVSVVSGQVTNVGTPFLTGWFTPIEGYVFDDINENGTRDANEPGIANYTVLIRDRDNSEIDRMSIAATTDADGYYSLPKGYPMTSWMMLEAYSDLFYSTGYTYWTDNYITPTTMLGSAVDVSLLPMLGQPGHLDWGVRPYDPTGTSGRPRNGGIVGTVSYETTRNELDPRYLAVEGWQPGIPNVRVNLYSAVLCGTTGATCDPDEFYELAADGSYAKGQLLNSTLTEQWAQPTGCTARDVSGAPLVYGVDQKVLPQNQTDKRCLEGPLMATQIKPDFGQLNGNYGFGDGCFGAGGFDIDTEACADGSDPTTLPADDYLVEVAPGDDLLGRPLYQVVKEEDINIFNGDQYTPAVPPPLCAGPLHTVDVANVGTDGYPAVNPVPGVAVPASSPVINPSFADGGGSPYEGQQRPLCNVKLVTLSNGKSVAPLFDFFTEVPIPGKWRGYIIDDLSVSTNLQDLFIGEKTGIAHSPIGIYDYANRLVTTIQSDPNGVYEVLLPSTLGINCPTPSGVCPNIYYLLGNDPGQPGAPNANYNPQFRTIGASFEIYPGLILPSDLAPTRIVPGVEAGGTTYAYPPQCNLDNATPQIYAVDKPYHRLSTGLGTITIRGLGFGATRGTGSVRLDTASLPITSWTDTQIVASVPITTTPSRYQLRVLGGNGKSTVNGLTYHVIGTVLPPFPATAVADNFNGNNANSFGGGWTDDAPNGVLSTSAGVAHIRTGNNVYNVWRTGGGGGGGGGILGVDQEAYFNFTQLSTFITTTEQGLLLKFNTVGGGGGGGGGTPSANNARWIEVAYTNSTTNTVVVRTKTNGSATITVQATFPATFAANDRLGARALSDGTIIAYKNGTEIGRTTVAATGTWTGRIGVRFRGTGTAAATEARIDNFGGGNIVLQGYNPNLYEVGPTYTYHTVQSAIDAAAASNGSDLVVVYPDTPVQWNPLGTYYENVVIYAPVTLQGIGPGGVYANNTAVLGSSIDGRGIAGDTQYATDWQTFVLGLNWSGVQAVYAGAVIYVLAENNEFTAANSAIVDGFTIQGGDQQGFPNNLNAVTPDIKDVAAIQGGGFFVNGYANSMRITNNIIRSNGGAYAGGIRLGTPNIAGTLGDSNNDNIKILNNRILANGGTNLAGAIGVFRGTDNYEIANNDICGNYSAEYGGGISQYGRSNNGSIHNNRIYFNQSYDEGGGIIIAGELPAVTTQLSPGAGPVDIYSNLIEANLSNDDGGGIRFLMAAGPGTGPTNNRTTFAFNVYNNIIVNNISTHEGGGVSINDAPNVRFYNNTVMKNLTTATAVTSDGNPAPTGLSTSRNSNLLQATLTGGVANCGTGGNNAPCFSNPILFNNIFWDNRAGRYTGADVAGIGLTGDPNPLNYWDLGVANFPGALLAPTNSMLQTVSGTVSSATNNVNVNPNVVALYDTSVDISAWRANPRFTNPIIVTTDATPNLLGDYHINAGSAAVNSGAASKTVGSTTVAAPTTDFDGAPRPQGGGYDKGADEIGPAAAPLAFAAVLDSFNADNGALSSNWSVNNTSNFAVNSQQLQSQANSGQATWVQSSFGANQEAYVTLAKVGNSSNTATRWQGVNLKVNGGAANSINASALEVRYSSAQGVQVRSKNAGSGWVNQAIFSIAFSDGDQLAAQALADGTVVVFKNGVLVGSINVTTGPNPWPAALAQAGGQIGISYNFSGGRIDDFGGGESTPVVTVSVATEEALGEIAEEEPATVEGIEDEESSESRFSIFMPLINGGDGSNQ